MKVCKRCITSTTYSWAPLNFWFIRVSQIFYNLRPGLSTTWLRSQIWLLGKIYLAPFRFTLCNAFWLRRVKRVQRKYIRTIYCTYKRWQRAGPPAGRAGPGRAWKSRPAGLTGPNGPKNFLIKSPVCNGKFKFLLIFYKFY